jgi:hypothetical protein
VLVADAAIACCGVIASGSRLPALEDRDLEVIHVHGRCVVGDSEYEVVQAGDDRSDDDGACPLIPSSSGFEGDVGERIVVDRGGAAGVAGGCVPAFGIGFGIGLDICVGVGYIYSNARTIFEIAGRAPCISGGAFGASVSYCQWGQGSNRRWSITFGASVGSDFGASLSASNTHTWVTHIRGWSAGLQNSLGRAFIRGTNACTGLTMLSQVNGNLSRNHLRQLGC